MEYIEIDKKVFLQKYQYADFEAFSSVCVRSGEANYMAIREIWNSGIEVYLIYKRFWFINNNIGFVSMIDSRKLRPKEKKAFSALGIPKWYNGIFINDMRMSIPYRHKGIGSKVVGKILRKNISYMLEPIEDGKYFWNKFGFEMDYSGKYACRYGVSKES